MAVKNNDSIDRIENAVEYIEYAKNMIKNDHSDICDELDWIKDSLEEELMMRMKKREEK